MIEKITNQNQIARHKLAEKINELVDAVNSLIYEIADDSDWYDDPKYREQPAENVQDKFAEQRRWIGKLCWFWDDNKEAKSCGILTEIAPENYDYKGQICPCLDDGGDGYMHCEPVKPDDDFIYKGGDNAE